MELKVWGVVEDRISQQITFVQIFVRMTVDRESVKLICTLFWLHPALYEVSGSGLCIS